MKDIPVKIVLVIPCLAETGIMQTIESLRQNTSFNLNVECLIVVNHAVSASDEIKSINENLLDQIRALSIQSEPVQLKFIAVEAFNQPDKKAGVGLARKIGMDRAVKRFKAAGTFKEAIIVCLDGDCTVRENYLAEIERQFTQNKTNGCSIYFEHPLDGENQGAIADYELFLRYYNNALRWSGFPYAFQTVGSSMAVSAIAYEKQGGMNTRKAGEDFYFLNKIIQLGKFGDLVSTTVYPSPRKSDRVPFGTGREMMEWEANRQLLSYHPNLFIGLKKIFGLADGFRTAENPIELLRKHELDSAFISYLIRKQFNEAIAEAKANTATRESFLKRFFVWMNAFRIMKLLNELSGSAFPKIPIQDCAGWLWKEISEEAPASGSKGMLKQFREFDRRNPKQIRK